MEEEQIQPIKEDEKTAGDAQKPEDTAPITSLDVGKIDAPRHTSNPSADTNKRKRKPLSCFEIWAIVLTLIGILVAGGTGGAIIWQDIIASRTLVEIQRQYPKLQESADAASTAAITAANGLGATINQFHLDQRAWINISFGAFHWVANEPLTAQVTWVNNGKTAAKGFSGQAMVEKVLKGQSPHFDYGRYATSHFGGGLLVPNAPINNFGFQSIRFKDGTREIEIVKASTEDSAEIQDGRAYLAVHGVIQYRDIFNIPHWLKFCSYASGSMAIQSFVTPCTDYNDTDNNQSN